MLNCIRKIDAIFLFYSLLTSINNPAVAAAAVCVVLKKVYRLILSKAPMTGDVELSLLVQKTVGGSMPPQAFLTV